MKNFMLIVSICVLFSGLAAAHSLNGICKEDGTVVEDQVVYAYSFGSTVYDVADVAFAFGTTSDASGLWNLESTATYDHFVIVLDPDETKHPICKKVTPDND